MEKLYHFRISLILIFLAFFLPSQISSADCEVNGGAEITGTAGADTIICDNNPAAPLGFTNVGGQAGSDTITIQAGTTVDSINGDDNGGVGGVFLRPLANGEDDHIIIHGSVEHSVDGDLLNLVNGGNDSIFVSSTGQTGIIMGDYLRSNSTGGNDTIQVDGISGNVFGENWLAAAVGSFHTGGNDLIIINGTADQVSGDSIRASGAGGNAQGGNDTIIIGPNATTGNIFGDDISILAPGTANGGDDSVLIHIGATTGTINGGNIAGDTDTLNFTGTIPVTTAERDAIVAYLTDVNAANGSIILGGKTYTWVNFEILGHSIIFTLTDLATNEVITIEVQAPASPSPNGGSCFDGYSNGLAVKCFIVDDFVQVYSGFERLPPNGVLVAVFHRYEAKSGDIFGNNDLNWSVQINPGGGSFILLDEAGNPISGSISY